MQEFFSAISVFEWAAVAVLILAFAAQVYHYVRYMAATVRYAKRQKPAENTAQNRQEGVSIIICARNEAENLTANLPAVLEQDYPQFEVIVINDGSVDDTDLVLERYSAQYSYLHTTFVPQGAHVLSTKKLGLSLGIKAAHYDHLLFTDADCRPASNRWLAAMANAFGPKTEFVLGFGAYDERDTLLNRLIGYETLFNGLQYLGMAAAGKPYMGVGRNLAYRKTFFFESGGFSGMLGLKAGDDDLFVNRHATPQNTRIVVEPEAFTWSAPKKNWRSYVAQKGRHLSVSAYYSAQSKRRLVAEPFERLLFYASMLALLCAGNLWLKLFAVFMFLVRWLMQMLVINRAARAMTLRRYYLTIMLCDILLPLLDLFLLARAGKYRQRW